MSKTVAQPDASRPAEPPKAPIKAAALQPNKDLESLDKRLVEAWKSAEDKAMAVYVLVAEADKAAIHLAYGKENLTDYLSDRLDCGRRTAQDLVVIAKLLTKHQIPAHVIKALPASAAREIAAYSSASGAKRDQVISLIEQYKERGWTIEELRQTLQKRLDNQRTAVRAKGQGTADDSVDIRKVRSLRFSDESWATVEEASSWVRQLTGSDDLPANITWSMVELAGMVKDNPKDALSGMLTLIDLARKDFSNLQTLALKADEDKRTVEARKLWEQLASGAFVQAVIAMQFISGSAELSKSFPDLSFKVCRQDPNADLVRRSSKNGMRVFAQVLGLPKKDMRAIEAMLGDDDEDEGEEEPKPSAKQKPTDDSSEEE